MPISPIGNLNFINQNAAYPSTQHANELAKEGFATAANMSEFKEKERALEKLEKVAQSSQISDEIEEKKEQEQGKKRGKHGREEDEAEAADEEGSEAVAAEIGELAGDAPPGFLTSLAGGAELLAAEAAERGVVRRTAKFAAAESAKSGRSPAEAGVGLVEGAGVGEANRGESGRGVVGRGGIEGAGRAAAGSDSGGAGRGGAGRSDTAAAHHLDLRI